MIIAKPETGSIRFRYGSYSQKGMRYILRLLGMGHYGWRSMGVYI